MIKPRRRAAVWHQDCLKLINLFRMYTGCSLTCMCHASHAYASMACYAMACSLWCLCSIKTWMVLGRPTELPVAHASRNVAPQEGGVCAASWCVPSPLVGGCNSAQFTAWAPNGSGQMLSRARANELEQF